MKDKIVNLFILVMVINVDLCLKLSFIFIGKHINYSLSFHEKNRVNFYFILYLHGIKYTRAFAFIKE